MGATHVTVQVRALAGRRNPFEAEFLVDAGAILSMAPASKLKQAGIKPTGKGSYELADGSSIELHFGHAIISFMGSTTATDIIFGPDDSEPLLGVVALESTGIMVDPVNQTLRRTHALPLKPQRPRNATRGGGAPHGNAVLHAPHRVPHQRAHHPVTRPSCPPSEHRTSDSELLFRHRDQRYTVHRMPGDVPRALATAPNRPNAGAQLAHRRCH